MRKRITKHVKEELKALINNKGYWSEEIRNYIGQFEYLTAKRLHSMAQTYEKYGQEF